LNGAARLRSSPNFDNFAPELQDDIDRAFKVRGNAGPERPEGHS
jgi:hypothetical protein